MFSVTKFLLLCADCLPRPCVSVQIENVDTCLSFLDARGVNVQGLSAEGKSDQQHTANNRPLLISTV